MTGGLELTFQREDAGSSPRVQVLVLNLTNTSRRPIVVELIRPRTPKGIAVREPYSTSTAIAQVRSSELLDDLDAIADAVVLTQSKDIRDAAAKDAKEWQRAAGVGISTVAQTLSPFFTAVDALLSPMARVSPARSMSPLLTPIESERDARATRELLLDLGAQPTSKELKFFDHKLKLLAAIEAEDRKAQRTIDAGTSVSIRYLVRLPRGGFEPFPVTFGVDVESRRLVEPVTEVRALVRAVRSLPGASRVTVRAAPMETVSLQSEETAIVVPPAPFKMSIVALLGAVFGFVVRVVSTESESFPGTSQDAFPFFSLDGSSVTDLMTSAQFGGALLVSLVLALITVHNLDRMPWTKSWDVGPGWRSALLIGTLIGIYGDRVLAALGTLVGTRGL